VRPEVSLVVAGSGEPSYEARVRREVSRLGLESVVRFAGFVDAAEKMSVLAESEILVQPSYQESFGLAVVEAMAAGLPVVVTTGVDLWPLIEARGAGLVAASSPAALADAILRLGGDPVLRAEMGSRGVSLVREEFAPQVIGAQL